LQEINRDVIEQRTKRATTIIASTTMPASAPKPAGRQPRTMATASTIVNASTASTNEARNAAVTADPRCKLLVTGGSSDVLRG
jgi:hypothetical protein